MSKFINQYLRSLSYREIHFSKPYIIVRSLREIKQNPIAVDSFCQSFKLQYQTLVRLHQITPIRSFVYNTPVNLNKNENQHSETSSQTNQDSIDDKKLLLIDRIQYILDALNRILSSSSLKTITNDSLERTYSLHSIELDSLENRNFNLNYNDDDDDSTTVNRSIRIHLFALSNFDLV